MKNKKQALEKLKEIGAVKKDGYYHGYRDAIAFIFEDHLIYKE